MTDDLLFRVLTLKIRKQFDLKNLNFEKFGSGYIITQHVYFYIFYNIFLIFFLFL